MAVEIPLGSYGHWYRKRHLSLRGHDANTHTHVIGVSGSGKSRFLASFYVNLIVSGGAATLIDPHGDLASLVLSGLIERGFPREKLVYLDLPEAERQGRYMPFNVLSRTQTPHALASNIKEAFHRAWPALSGGSAPMFDTLVQDGVKVLISNGLPLTGLYRLLSDQAFRDRLLEKEPDPDIVAFFHDQFDRLAVKDQVDQAGAALRRSHLLTFSPVLKYSLGQQENALDYRALMDEGKSVIVNLALPDPDARRLLGCLLTVSAEQAALSRADVSPAKRGPSHHLIIDEFSEFTAQSEEALSRMLSLTRKYGLFLVMAHQTWAQASERFQGALQNCGLEVAFRLGRDDAETTARQLGRVAPRSFSHRHGESGESHGMNEQWEEQAQHLMDLKPQWAMIRKPLAHLPWPWHLFWHRPTTMLYKVKTPPMPDPEVSPEKVTEMEAYYLRTYFRPQSEAEESLAMTRAIARPPVRRESLT